MAFNIKFDIKWIIIPAAIIVGLLIFGIGQHGNNKQLETYNRQLSGNLSDAERELQSAHYELGVAKSKLVTQKELGEILKNDNEEKDKEFEKFKKDNNLVIKSRDKSIAQLKQQIKNGITTIEVGSSCNIDNLQGCTISYQWKDPYNRFKLIDPNIFEDGAKFESNQSFKIYGTIYEQKDSSLQIRKLTLREVYKDESGEYKDIEGAKADIVESDFQYHNPPALDTEFDWKDLFRLRGIVVAGVNAFPNSGNAKLGLGLEFFTWKGLGINSHTSFDFDDATQISQNLGLIYNPTILNTELNLGIGVSGGTPFASFFKEFMLSIDLVFYVNN